MATGDPSRAAPARYGAGPNDARGHAHVRAPPRSRDAPAPWQDAGNTIHGLKRPTVAAPRSPWSRTPATIPANYRSRPEQPERHARQEQRQGRPRGDRIRLNHCPYAEPRRHGRGRNERHPKLLPSDPLDPSCARLTRRCHLPPTVGQDHRSAEKREQSLKLPTAAKTVYSRSPPDRGIDHAIFPTAVVGVNMPPRQASPRQTGRKRTRMLDISRPDKELSAFERGVW